MNEQFVFALTVVLLLLLWHRRDAQRFAADISAERARTRSETQRAIEIGWRVQAMLDLVRHIWPQRSEQRDDPVTRMLTASPATDPRKLYEDTRDALLLYEEIHLHPILVELSGSQKWDHQVSFVGRAGEDCVTVSVGEEMLRCVDDFPQVGEIVATGVVRQLAASARRRAAEAGR